MKLSNKDIGNKAMDIVIKKLQKKYKSKDIQDLRNFRKEGCDIIVKDKIFIEVKGTTTEARKKSGFRLTKKEFNCAKKNKKYYLYWVDVNKKKIEKILKREEILNESKARTYYWLNLTTSRREILGK